MHFKRVNFMICDLYLNKKKSQITLMLKIKPLVKWLFHPTSQWLTVPCMILSRHLSDFVPHFCSPCCSFHSNHTGFCPCFSFCQIAPSLSTPAYLLELKDCLSKGPSLTSLLKIATHPPPSTPFLI